MVDIRDADTDDADAVVEMWLALAEGQRQYGSHIPAEPNRTQIRESVLRHITAEHLLIAQGDRCRGFVMFTVEQGSFEQDVDRGIIENLYVRPECRGEGTGSELLAAAERRLEDRGVDTVALNVMADNDAARKFYRRHGYAPHRLEVEKSVEQS
ncbi:GNAT family N-acetyltransferase [Halovenus sp. WSH3]|uniref:GNAT family N-acetyltransferase n=1 Tax=Halovenus carboxidivorans TaxID=2692199 RepID=A0A6B0T1M1_9EURY|nr:GNAT family N-acetyltransferase [Halovenus carboxidivorans]MXR51865.1 GNAT family N-acetyltransferase [Halovenus carboxidivorans]